MRDFTSEMDDETRHSPPDLVGGGHFIQLTPYTQVVQQFPTLVQGFHGEAMRYGQSTHDVPVYLVGGPTTSGDKFRSAAMAPRSSKGADVERIVSHRTNVLNNRASATDRSSGFAPGSYR